LICHVFYIREELGVPVRVEIGPQDVVRGSCVVAKAGEAGTVAQKTSVNMSNALVKHVRQALVDAGVEVPMFDANQGDDNEGGDALSDDEGLVLRVKSEAGRAASTGQGAMPGDGGDDMDDFELEVEADEEGLTMSKKELAKKRRKEDKAKKRATKLQGVSAASKILTGDGTHAVMSDDESKHNKGLETSVIRTKTVIF
jgi:hypothetical protein